MHTFTAAPPGDFLAMLRRNADIDQRRNRHCERSEAIQFCKTFSRVTQSFSGSTMAGDFFGAAEAAGATDAAAGGGVAMDSVLICGLCFTAEPRVVTVFASAIVPALPPRYPASGGPPPTSSPPR